MEWIKDPRGQNVRGRLYEVVGATLMVIGIASALANRQLPMGATALFASAGAFLLGAGLLTAGGYHRDQAGRRLELSVHPSQTREASHHVLERFQFANPALVKRHHQYGGSGLLEELKLDETRLGVESILLLERRGIISISLWLSRKVPDAETMTVRRLVEEAVSAVHGVGRGDGTSAGC